MSVLDDAKNAVHGPRAADYGHPSVNHGTTAALMRAYLKRRYGEAQFDAVDVCAFNLLQKISRLANTPDHYDSLVDIAGYAENWDMVRRGHQEADAALQSNYVDLVAG